MIVDDTPCAICGARAEKAAKQGEAVLWQRRRTGSTGAYLNLHVDVSIDHGISVMWKVWNRETGGEWCERGIIIDLVDKDTVAIKAVEYDSGEDGTETTTELWTKEVSLRDGASCDD